MRTDDQMFSAPGAIQIADQPFQLARTAFYGYLSRQEQGWDTEWALEFEGVAREIGDATWQPQIASHALRLALPPPHRLPGSAFPLPDAEDGEPAFMVYVFEHAPLRGGTMAFGAWDGHSIDLTLEGIADVWADERYDCDLPISIHGPLPFEGIVVDEGSASRAIST